MGTSHKHLTGKAARFYKEGGDHAYFEGQRQDMNLHPTSPFFLTTPSGLIHATAEQEMIIHAATRTKDSLLINALAGAAKTSTLEFICKYLPVSPILCLAFNKRIATEMTERLPGHVTCRTMNSMGHRVWGTAVGRRLAIDFKKSYNILREALNDLSQYDRAESYETFGDTLRILSFAKRAGYIPDGKYPHAKPLMTREAFYAALEDEPTPLQVSLVELALTTSIKLAYAGTIDFDDQIYMPTLFGGSFPRFPLVMVDEAQDLSEINHAMLRKLVTGRIIAVGDPWQSIYAFRGAKQSGMAALARTYNAVSLPLSVSFRCPQAIVEYARARVPHMQWRKPGGLVRHLDSLDLGSIPDGAAVICRNNAPLFRLALLLLTIGRGVHLVGTDLGPQLIKTLKKLGPETLTKDETYAAIDAWKAERLAKARNKAAIDDKSECLKVFAEFGDTLGGAIAYCEHLFAGHGAIQLLSGHKAKGLEWEVVYHLDPWRIPSPYAHEPEDIEQEKNVHYVITTRAKQELYEISLENVIVEPKCP